MPINIIAFIIFTILVIGLAIYFSTKDKRKVKQALKATFPNDWKQHLIEKVPFYKNLDNEDRAKFEKRVQSFLAIVKVQGVNMKVDDYTKLLVAASAVIPLFEWPQWKYAGLREVFIYPQNFDADFEAGKNKNILGMVGNSPMINHLMILSKPALEKGFEHPRNKEHVGYHEFAHLIDRADGSVDGVPTFFLPKKKINVWLKLVQKEMARIRDGNSDINPYALTNESEFFAVLSEYYLENPKKLEKRHPALFEILDTVFQGNNDK